MAKERKKEQLLTAARVQTATWGVLIIWVGVMMAFDFDNRNEGLGITILGAIFLISGIAQRMQVRHQGGGFIIAGVTMLLLGVNDLLDENLSVGAIAVIVIGVLVFGSAFWKPTRGRTRAADAEPEQKPKDPS